MQCLVYSPRCCGQVILSGPENSELCKDSACRCKTNPESAVFIPDTWEGMLALVFTPLFLFYIFCYDIGGLFCVVQHIILFYGKFMVCMNLF